MPRALLCTLAMPLSAIAGGGMMAWEVLPPLPEPLGLAAPFAGVSNGALLTAGGANFPNGMPWEGGKKVWHDRVYVLERPDGKWREAGKLPRPLAYGGSVTWRDQLICVGGSDSTRHYAEVFALSWKDGEIRTAKFPPLPLPLSNAAIALAGEQLYVACGAEAPGEQAASNRAFSMNLAAPSPIWTELSPFPGKARILAMAGSSNGRFHVFAGAALEANADGKIARTYLKDSWEFDPAKGWQERAPLSKPLAAAPSPVPILEGIAYFIAGDDGSRVKFEPVKDHPGFPPTILAYALSPQRCTDAGITPAPRATAPVVFWKDRFVIPSGEVRPGVRSPEVWAFRRKN